MTALRLSWLEEKRRGLIIIWFSPWRNQVEKLPTGPLVWTGKLEIFSLSYSITWLCQSLSFLLLVCVNSCLSYNLNVSSLLLDGLNCCLPCYMTSPILVFCTTWQWQSSYYLTVWILDCVKSCLFYYFTNSILVVLTTGQPQCLYF